MRPLNLNQQLFIARYLSRAPLNASAAYASVYGVSERVASVEACRLMKDERVQAEIARWQSQLRDKLELTVADITRELTLVASADPRELSEYYVGACRHCYGDGFKYQRTPAEYERDLKAHIDRRKYDKEKGPDEFGLDFDIQGGVGFTPKHEPNPDCPECFGDGIGYEVFKDTRTLSPAAARLYQGVKRTQHGLEIKTRDPDKAVQLAGQHLGMFKTGLELSGPGGGPMQHSVTSMSDEELAAIVAAGQAAQQGGNDAP